MRLLRFGFLLVLLSAFPSLHGISQESAEAPEAGRAEPVGGTEDAPARQAEMALKSGDIISINVFDEPSLSGAFPIGPDGSVVFPLLGAISASGISASGVAREIEVRLEQDYIRDAQVTVALAEESEVPPEAVTVIGQVMSPGQVHFDAGTSIDLFTAIASAGGMAERANRSRIELKRRSGSDLKTQFLHLDNDRVFQLREGDTIIVHNIPEVKPVVVQMESITIIGEVKRPGPMEMDPDSPYDIITAIAMAGGFTPLARTSKVVVRRMTEAGVKAYELNVGKMQKDQTAPFLLQPNDTITVPESIF